MGSGCSQGLPMTLCRGPIDSSASQLPSRSLGPTAVRGRLTTQAEDCVLAIGALAHCLPGHLDRFPLWGGAEQSCLVWETPSESRAGGWWQLLI